MITNRQLFLNYIAQTTPNPLGIEVESAKGVYIYGPEGNRWLDMIAGISVSNLGHCHPEVVLAIQEQASKYMHLMVYGEYIYSPQVKLAQLLLTKLPASLDNFYFTNSGTEATEGAIKLAKRVTGRSEIISYFNAYHGSTAGALSAMGAEVYKSQFRPLVPGHSNIRYNEFEDLQKITKHTAAIIIEPVQAEAGIVKGNIDYFKALKERCKETGTLLILDEIQTGCGRTGSFFAFEWLNICPDILLLGKALGGGMPIAAFISSKNIMSALSHSPILGHISTFGGNPVTCAAAFAAVSVMLNSDLLSAVEEKGAYIERKLRYLGIVNIRRVGLMMAIDFQDQMVNFAVIESCIQEGIITDWFLFNTSSMRICPPLIISMEEIDEFLEIFTKVLKAKNLIP